VTSPMKTNENEIDRHPELEERYMRMALKVAESALDVGEVPVGCVIVLRHLSQTEEQAPPPSSSLHSDNNEDSAQKYASPLSSGLLEDPSVIVSHGANQVNATRDATRHAECVAIDRMLTGGLASDRSRLPPSVVIKAAHGKVPSEHPLSTPKSDVDHSGQIGDDVVTLEQPKDLNKVFADYWINIPTEKNHWKNSYGWGSGRIYQKNIFSRCDLYVTCEPCIMVRS